MGSKNSFTAQFENDLDSLIEENIKLQEEENRLTTKVRKLQKSGDGPKKSLMQLTKEITSKPAGKRSEDSKAVVEALKGNIERSQRNIADLKAQVHSKGRLADPNINIEELMSEKRNAEMKLSHSRAHLEQVRDNHRLKEEMFHSEKGFESSLFMNLKTIQ